MADSDHDSANGKSPLVESPSAVAANGRAVKRVASRVPSAADLHDPNIFITAKNVLEQERHKWADETRGWTWYNWLAFYVPIAGWLPNYNVKAWLLWDVFAGLSTACMVIPQGMSYANLAGLPYVYGLYGAFVPTIIYALFGTSRQLVVGPVAVTSILLANGLNKVFDGNVNEDPNNPTDAALQDQYNQAAVQVAFVAGFLYLAIGVLRMGWLIQFLSASVISGFMTGASITIALSQVKYILGLKIPRSDKLIPSLENIFNNLNQFKWREFCMGMAFILLLLVFRYLSARHKKLLFLKALGPLTVCIISIALMNIFDWYSKPDPAKPYIKPIGKIPKGLPGFTGGWWLPLYNVSQQMTLAVLICMVDICESISIAKAMARVNKYQLNYTQELRGLGIANVFGAMFNCYTTTGSFSRSAVNNSVGAKTPLAGMVTGFTIMLVLLVLTPVFTNMSQNVQGAIIIVGVLQLFDWQEFIYLWTINKLDWIVWCAAFLFTIFLGVEVGIGVAVGLSLVMVIYKSAFPRISTLGRLPGTDIYRSERMYPAAEHQPGLLLLRIDAPVYFANVESLRDFINTAVARSRVEGAKCGQPVKFVILDLGPVHDVDATAIHWLEDFIAQLQDEGVQLVLANPTKDALLMLKRGGVYAKLGEDRVHVTVADAVAYAQSQVKILSAQNAV